MSEIIIKELGKMSGFMSELWRKEKDSAIKKGLLELLEMVDEKLLKVLKIKELNEVTPFFIEVISRIKRTENLVKEFKKKSKTYGDLLDHVIKVSNEVEGLFFGLELMENPNPDEQSINKKNKEQIT